MVKFVYLSCYVCKDPLVDPVALSCGYTVCRDCVDIIPQKVFHCPVPDCNQPSHLFGRSLHPDTTVFAISRLITNTAHPSSELSSHLTQKSSALSTIMECMHCHDPFSDPITTHCGHTFCRLCALFLKATKNHCSACKLPLPRYTSLVNQPSNRMISQLSKKLFQDTQRRTSRDLGSSNRHKSVVLYVSQAIILPHQRFRLPVMPEDRSRFQTCLLKSSRYDNVCIGMVYCGTKLSLMGTLVKILAVEHRSDGILLVDLAGLDRFQVLDHSPYIKEDTDTSLLATINILPEIHLSEDCVGFQTITDTELSSQSSLTEDETNEESSLSVDVVEIGRPLWAADIMPQQDDTFNSIDLPDDETESMTITIRDFIHRLASPPVTGCKASTEGLFGPTWFTNIQILHGDMPPLSRSAALCWWVSFVLPILNKDKLRLLKTLPLKSRLALVLSWIDRLEQQWTFRSDSLPVSTKAM
ncbi:hypothetical protein PHYBLDRAFT_85770 [Phycomyces blakesleeanus NRRL 1555(-)]|uniref:RING-type domain-containing protein n=2 Tax=Phycomyces blakesleeanus TaxID=4837 RepID=A0A167K436_PHYB8|nr:hypothetical protein PHYBLDRAFT_85770 [Phycomyces blakesleeanus NRRL 1555(-)]OAD67236.1 hypothetical protein PHYBLDRAFT_85770 [Phycomyces blakesleeanus NRRL 1555(-)]CRI62800.1 LON peptidase N-terminal domain and Ring Finger similar to CrgA [Phycomyces blakesleeanus]|eukprot:XP_018285276.1 hypothetical protein PHYBLDRAFT_85770 [Phycomyces blakesleeanus NRRL 1555(-)]